MKTLIRAIAIASVLATPAVTSSAQGDGTVTRAQVRAELEQLERAGYNPARSAEPNYPDDILAAQARILQWNAASQANPGGAADRTTIGAPPSGNAAP
ncbi:DUF4148 domain-containing protein [Paraburkholderia jirisanensis]